MDLRKCVFVCLLVASAAHAEPPVDVYEAPCSVLVSYIETPEIVERNTAIFLEGFLHGAMAAIPKDVVGVNFVTACQLDNTATIHEVVAIAIDTADPTTLNAIHDLLRLPEDGQ